MISCEIELDLSWSRNCVISEILRTPEVGGSNPADATQTKVATFNINNARLHVSVVVVSINDNTKFLENIKQ